MRVDFYERLDRLYADEPRSVEAFLQETMAQCRQENDLEGMITVSNELGSLFRGQGRYAESLEAFQEALQRMESLGLADSTPYLTALMNRAGTLRLANRAEEAVSDFRRILSLLEGGTDGTLYIRASALNNLGLAYQSLGNLDKAEKCAKQALEIIQTLPGMEAETASSGNNLAALCLRQNRLEDAERWLMNAMAYYQTAAGQRDPHLASAYMAMAALRCGQDRLEEALSCYDQAVSATERFFGKNRNYASASYDAALVAHALGRADAVERLKQAGSLYEALDGPESPAAQKARQLLTQWEGAGQ